MILTSLLRLEAVLAGAVAANQPEVHVDYKDWTSNSNNNQEIITSAPDTFRVALNSATDVIILAAPVSSPKREILLISVYNKDTATATVIIKTDDGTTERIIIRRTLLTLESLHFSKNVGWYWMSAA